MLVDAVLCRLFLLVEARTGGFDIAAVVIPLWAVDHLDSEVTEANVHLVQLRRNGDHLVGQDLYDLVVEDVPLVLAKLDQRLDRRDLLLDWYHVGNRQIVCS